MKLESNHDAQPKNYSFNYSKLAKALGLITLSSTLLVACGGGGGGGNNGGGNDDNRDEDPAPPVTQNTPSRSTTIALTSDDSRLVVVNRQKNSVSVIEVKDEIGEDSGRLIGEVATGQEPRYVAITPDDSKALVTNAVDGTVSIVDISTSNPSTIGRPIPVGTEPRGIAITPNGKYAYVANHTAGTVTVISINNSKVVNTIDVGGNPMAIAITNDGDADDNDENVYITRFFSEVIDPINRPDGFNDSKQGKVNYFSVATSLTGAPLVNEYNIAPLDNAGFAADRRQFCQNTRNVLQDNGDVVFFNSGADGLGDGAAALKNEVFCPDTVSSDASADGDIAKTLQGAYTNQLYAAMIRNDMLFIPNVGASPEPPVKFNVNVQALISSIDLSNGIDNTINLNDQIKAETQPDPENESLDRLFGNDIVAIDADSNGEEFLIVSRGGNYVMRASLDGQGQLDIDASSGVIRFKTGNIPSGVVMSQDGSRAYTNNEVNTSVTSIDLDNNQVLTQDISSSTPPAPGTQEHRNLLGKLVFFTALGTPDTFDLNGDGEFDIDVRDIDPLTFRGKASDNGWSSCASCHEDGHSDNVTWIFPTGPRQTIPLEGTFSKNDSDDQRILNWNAVRGSVTDFNNNSRGVQGGTGFATDLDNNGIIDNDGTNRTGDVFNHGPTEGISDALDAMTEWVANTVKAPIMPDVTEVNVINSGRETFETHCASCHSGDKWTKSTISAYQNNPTFPVNPIGADFFNGVSPLDPDLVVAGPQIQAINDLTFLDDVGSLFADNDLEIRGAGAIAGQSTQGFNSLGGAGFNTPSLLGVGYSAPYLHDGSAITLEDVFAVHTIPSQGGEDTIDAAIDDATTLNNLIEFVLSIDDDTPIFDTP